ncbi:MAG: deoxyuridine 5'-triphosphate nucleotidohydrolase [Thermoproteota archaeon]|nr:deoxyuridine 5'-triphosphate nucleotidohydrolase [Candidatus Brockarchaeota archaeon]MBO3762760.1 deoxyuridine 5'-triphosphate nucleotidohydrolase [Candidatus Brockarchaeota archaeon]MBO3768525.1 deoxyuridine 5'-triphosphate nucleotidohydrolase [Candidatus Brockarchaeota archaeon]MBO3801331.1 deoxyuridine 5'-triphosphate nucleotidohydrolase [Candidatus Brockarchaeota archaeon]
MSVLIGREIIEGGIVSNLKSITEQIQPAGVDLTLDEVEVFLSQLVLSEKNPELAKVEKLSSLEGKYSLNPGAYKITYSETISIPDDAIGLVFPRSSLLRSGIVVYTAVWDPGYKGKGSGLLLVLNPSGAILWKGSRLAQLIIIKTTKKPDFIYRGKYQNEGIT